MRSKRQGATLGGWEGYTNLGKWERWYGMLGTDPEPYGLTETYQIGADWLSDCELIEDWGCGKGWFRNYIDEGSYRGIDGSHSPFSDEVVDLATYRSEVPGIFMRHVLEHDFRWTSILDNALRSFTNRMALILFTPYCEEGKGQAQIAWNEDPGVPDLSFDPTLLEEIIKSHGVKIDSRETLSTATQYGVEHVWLLSRESDGIQ